MNRKAAIEMSMNTIIVIVIGVVLLSLGLVFVRSIFSGVSEISQGAFDEAKSALGTLGQIDSLLTISPVNTQVSQGGDRGIAVVVLNVLEVPLKYKLVATPSDKNLDCLFSVKSGWQGETEETTILSGKQKEYYLGVKEKNGGIRIAQCYIEIIGAPEGEDNAGQVVVKIEK